LRVDLQADLGGPAVAAISGMLRQLLADVFALCVTLR
jgi:hypothetical protein